MQEEKIDNIFSKNPNGLTEKLNSCNILVAGAGGLGSNAAMLLVRAGIGKIGILDFDRVDATNLNRQYYDINDIGKYKVEALKNKLLLINPNVEIFVYNFKLMEDNIDKILSQKWDVILECFDKAQSKALLINNLLLKLPKTPIIAVSGIAGIGSSHSLPVKKHPKYPLWIIGDQESDCDVDGTFSARVMLASCMQVQQAIFCVCKS